MCQRMSFNADSLGAEAPTDTYVGVMRYNADTIHKALVDPAATPAPGPAPAPAPEHPAPEQPHLSTLPSKPRLLPPKRLLSSMPQKKKSKSALAVRDLTVSYGSNRVVDDVSFRVPQGTVMGLIGPNGAGKSTIIKSVIDLIPLERGDIRFFWRAAVA